MGFVTSQVGDKTTAVEVPGQRFFDSEITYSPIWALNMISLEQLLWPILALSSFSSLSLPMASSSSTSKGG